MMIPVMQFSAFLICMKGRYCEILCRVDLWVSAYEPTRRHNPEQQQRNRRHCFSHIASLRASGSS